MICLPAGIGAVGPAAGGGGIPSAISWRYTDVVVAGSFFEIEELRFCDSGGSPIDGGASISSSIAPDFGSLANLIDGSGARVYWSKSHVDDPSFWIQIDFGAPTAPAGVRMQGHSDADRFPTSLSVSYDNGGGFVLQKNITGIAYPGSGVQTPLLSIA